MVCTKENNGFWNADRLFELEGLLKKGTSYTKIGEHFGVSGNSISRIVKRQGLTVVTARHVVRSTSYRALARGKPTPPRNMASQEPVGSEPQPIGPESDFPARGGCKWVHGHPGVPGQTWRMCGHPARSGAPYCDHHMRKAGGSYAKKVA